MAVAKLACADIRVNVWYGLSVLLSTVVLDAFLILVSYTLILNAVFRLPSRGAWQKALGTCGSHFGVISMFYLPGIFTIITQRLLAGILTPLERQRWFGIQVKMRQGQWLSRGTNRGSVGIQRKPSTVDHYRPIVSGQRVRGAAFFPPSLKPGLKKGRRGPAKAHSEKV
ncbi:hypothetical protein HPG69_005643 [Diceros bicornis minor]|uniref:G-protein coupled receptors family 1 profile domain-containing protein n=1 Tax=Diceros bicornis minor TaxID=77932 RepID=A0A7J7ES51_DICBM|nr:hypothetical protein HPG69_005643 [Diceros bicornis minor]